MADDRHWTVNIRCPECGNTGTATFYKSPNKVGSDGRQYWNFLELTGHFDHHEYSLGGAKIICSNTKRTCGATAFNPN